MTDSKTKVLYIAGNGRSGSTLLDVLLGQVEGTFAVGELRRIWDRGFIENRPCGCGAPFLECPTWNAIFDEAFGGMDAIDPQKLVGYRERMTQTKHLPGMVLRGRHARPKGEMRLDYLATLEKLYAAIPKVTGCEVIVDASKWPMYAYMLDLLPNVELYVLHLVRDPRATAYSWSRKKEYDPGLYLPQQGLVKNNFYWLMWNPAITRLWNRPDANYLFFPYEQFIREPETMMQKAVELVGLGDRELPFVDASTVQMGPTHAVAGNVARHTQGPVKLRLDDEWQTKLPWARKAIVSAFTWPLLGRYGYSVMPR